MKNLILICTFICLSMPAFAQDPSPAGGKENVHSIQLPETRVALKQAPGVEKATGFCSICHSLDYITTQPAFSRSQWSGTVNKMIKVMGAPIPEEDAKTIIDYLAANYGNGK